MYQYRVMYVHKDDKENTELQYRATIDEAAEYPYLMNDAIVWVEERPIVPWYPAIIDRFCEYGG